jgi:hypothetical protein
MRHLKKGEQEAWTERYQALMIHYGMQPTWNNTGVAHENGDVEQSHFRFKEAVDQALRVRGSRDFTDRRSYEAFLQHLVSERARRADQEYVRILHLAASTCESEFETALTLLLEAGKLPTSTAVRDLVSVPRTSTVPHLVSPTLDLSPYDHLLPSRRSHA